MLRTHSASLPGKNAVGLGADANSYCQEFNSCWHQDSWASLLSVRRRESNVLEAWLFQTRELPLSRNGVRATTRSGF
jgi:hypothetical protein